MTQKKEKAIIISQVKLQDDVLDMWIHTKEISSRAKAGQFISIYTKDGAKLLPRPISICEINKSEEKIRIVYRVLGEGTKEFSGYQKGDEICILGPLGNGFPIKDKKAFLIGGGIGIPPMLQLAKELNCKKQIILGYRDVTFLDKDLEQYGDVYIATEDGSRGAKGNVINAIEENRLNADIIYACGPTPMLRAIKAYASEHNIECWLSLEERMACGIGACLACVCKTKEIDHHSNVHNKRICKDGPVFLAEEVDLS